MFVVRMTTETITAAAMQTATIAPVSLPESDGGSGSSVVVILVATALTSEIAGVPGTTAALRILVSWVVSCNKEATVAVDPADSGTSTEYWIDVLKLGATELI